VWPADEVAQRGQANEVARRGQAHYGQDEAFQSSNPPTILPSLVVKNHQVSRLQALEVILRQVAQSRIGADLTGLNVTNMAQLAHVLVINQQGNIGR